MSALGTHGSARGLRPSSVNFVPAVAYHICPSLPAAFTQPGPKPLAEPCRWTEIVKQLFVFSVLHLSLCGSDG